MQLQKVNKKEKKKQTFLRSILGICLWVFRTSSYIFSIPTNIVPGINSNNIITTFNLNVFIDVLKSNNFEMCERVTYCSMILVSNF